MSFSPSLVILNTKETLLPPLLPLPRRHLATRLPRRRPATRIHVTLTPTANLTTNRTLLERIARETGGELVVDSDLDRFAADMPTRKVPVSESWVYPIWHRPWVMITAMLCLCGEWGLRRWKGLA